MPLRRRRCPLHGARGHLHPAPPDRRLQTLRQDPTSQKRPNPALRPSGRPNGEALLHDPRILRDPLDHLRLFPYYSNYLKLGRVEFNLLSQHCSNPSRVAFVGSGPLPLTSIVLASHPMKSAVFHNYDIDASANSMAMRLVESHPDLSKRMEFRTTDIMDASGAALKDYNVVFLAALVGMEIEEKIRVIEHASSTWLQGLSSC
ncbi:hypothetical protein DH2020_045162 [Rehmannia glutinosa]|uniref:Nicotianamine synthase n=1 Tax=Rehmannia glutinosa TaxID=99300 RepID=A0ABR0UEY0_REHGL